MGRVTTCFSHLVAARKKAAKPPSSTSERCSTEAIACSAVGSAHNTDSLSVASVDRWAVRSAFTRDLIMLVANRPSARPRTRFLAKSSAVDVSDHCTPTPSLCRFRCERRRRRVCARHLRFEPPRPRPASHIGGGRWRRQQQMRDGVGARRASSMASQSLACSTNALGTWPATFEPALGEQKQLTRCARCHSRLAVVPVRTPRLPSDQFYGRDNPLTVGPAK